MKQNPDSLLCTRCGGHLVSRADPDGSNVEPSLFGAELSRSEQLVLAYLRHGYSNKQIAQRLAISPNTVRFHLKRMYVKLGARSRAHAVARGGLTSSELRMPA